MASIRAPGSDDAEEESEEEKGWEEMKERER